MELTPREPRPTSKELTGERVMSFVFYMLLFIATCTFGWACKGGRNSR